MSTINTILDQIDENLASSLNKFKDLLAFPSVSSLPEGKAGIEACAVWLRSELNALGFEARVVPTDGHPLVMAECQVANDAPKILLYGHYDVQPADPLEDWHTPPFEPAIKQEDGLTRIYARGAADSKGQFWAAIEALRAWKMVTGDMPTCVTIMLEGEEETGSPNLAPFIREHLEELRCDAAFNTDSDMWSPDRPAITTRLKGLIHEKVTIIAPNGDLHSGHFGNVAVNPVRILTKSLASIHDEEGKVLIPGFYDGVEPISASLRETWEAMDVDEALAGVSTAGGPSEGGFGPVELMWGRPGIDFCGIVGGNTGPSERSVLPASASARLSFRLVGAQHPDHIRSQFRSFIQAQVPAGCSVEFEGAGGCHAVTVNEDSPYIAATARALDAEWPEPTLIKGTGGAVPVVGLLAEHLNVDVVTTGFILGDDAIHAPNERYDLDRLRKSIRSWVRIFSEIETLKP